MVTEKSFWFLAALLHNSALTSHMKLVVNVYRLSRSHTVTYVGISVDVKIHG